MGTFKERGQPLQKGSKQIPGDLCLHVKNGFEIFIRDLHQKTFTGVTFSGILKGDDDDDDDFFLIVSQSCRITSEKNIKSIHLRSSNRLLNFICSFRLSFSCSQQISS